jgi:hypothetical protein
LWLGLLAYRWATFAWMARRRRDARTCGARPALAAVLATGAWNVWFSLTGGWTRTVDRGIDLALAFALLPLSGIVMREGAIEDGILFFATSFPATAALTTGAGGGIAAGLSAGAALSVGLALSRIANGMDLTDASGSAFGALVNGALLRVGGWGRRGRPAGPRQIGRRAGARHRGGGPAARARREDDGARGARA